MYQSKQVNSEIPVILDSVILGRESGSNVLNCTASANSLHPRKKPTYNMLPCSWDKTLRKTISYGCCWFWFGFQIILSQLARSNSTSTKSQLKLSLSLLLFYPIIHYPRTTILQTSRLTLALTTPRVEITHKQRKCTCKTPRTFPRKTKAQKRHHKWIRQEQGKLM